MENFEQIGLFDGSLIENDNYRCCLVQGNYAYIGGDGYLWILDITDKTNPTLLYRSGAIVDSIKGLALDAAGYTLYVAGVGLSENTIYAIDVTDKENPVNLGSLPLVDIDVNYFAFLGSNQTLLRLNDDTIVVLIETNDGNTLVQAINVSNPASMVAQGFVGLDYEVADDRIWKMAVGTNDDVYVAVQNTDSDSARIEQYDFSDPENPALNGTSEEISGLLADAVDIVGGFTNNGERVFAMLAGGDGDWILYVADFNGDTSPVFEALLDTEISAHPAGWPMRQMSYSNGCIVSIDYNEEADPQGHIILFEVTEGEEDILQVEDQGGGSVFFASPFFYTTNEGEYGSDNQFYIWEIGGATRGFFYGDDNVIYRED